MWGRTQNVDKAEEIRYSILYIYTIFNSVCVFSSHGRNDEDWVKF